MGVQFLTNAKGKKTSVVIPLKEWDNSNKKKEDLQQKLEEAEMKLRFKQILTDTKLFEKGELKTYPIAELFNEL